MSLYRRVLHQLGIEKVINVYSHELARLAGVTAAQVRRDIMAVGYSGSPSKGYDVEELMESIGRFLDGPEDEKVALVGVGNLGRAIMAYFGGRRPNLSIGAAFDIDPEKARRVIHGCRCYSMADLEDVVAKEGIRVGVITVPAVEAQAVCDRLVRAGVYGILNFAPVALRVPDGVFVELIDMAMSLEKVTYFAREGASERNMAK